MPAPELALAARARGLAAHLLTRDALESLARLPDVPALARALSRAGLEPAGEAPGLKAVEQAVRRTHARAIATLRRFAEGREGVLAVFDVDQDRRSLRALLRGAFQGATSEARLAGLLPTPWLPERALAELARQATPAAVVAHLVVLRHPEASRLLALTQQTEPELFEVEVALLAGLAERAGAVARRGDGALRDFVAARVDVGNAQNALLLAEGPRDVEAAHCFVEGGRWLTSGAFVAATEAVSRPAAFEVLRQALAPTPLAPVFKLGAEDAAAVERAFLAQQFAWLLQLGRVDPLGSAPTLRFLLRLEAQGRDLRAVAWGVRTQAPAALVARGLVTPWN